MLWWWLTLLSCSLPFKYDSTFGINPKSTDCEADAPTTTSSPKCHCSSLKPCSCCSFIRWSKNALCFTFFFQPREVPPWPHYRLGLWRCWLRKWCRLSKCLTKLPRNINWDWSIWNLIVKANWKNLKIQLMSLSSSVTFYFYFLWLLDADNALNNSPLENRKGSSAKKNSYEYVLSILIQQKQ